MKGYPITSKNFISLLLLLFKVCWALPAPAAPVTKCPANTIMKRSSANELVKSNESQNYPNFMNGSYKRFSKSDLPTGADRVRFFSLRSAFKVSKPTTISTSTSRTSKSLINRSNGKCSYEPTPYYKTNFESSCRSYSFCSAGYEITYLCSPNQLFNGTKCVEEADYKCPSDSHDGRNNFHQNQNCKFLSNGYYKNEENPQLYFYCYEGNRVIDLSCPKGKIFDSDKCIFEPKIEDQPLFRIASVKKKEEKLKLDLNQLNSCTDKENGFFTEIGTSCKKYYFCIAEVKTSLECSGSGRIFNGDICVDDEDFKCSADNEIESTNE